MRFKLFEEFLNEGINDPGILKAFFMAGGPGSGKSFVATELFGFPKGAESSVSYATGLKLVNIDNAFEAALRKAGLDVGKLAQYAKDPKMWDEIVKPLRNKAKGLTKRMQDNYIAGRLGQVVDGTGKDFKKLAGKRKLYEDLGYDTYMVFVNTSLEVALERNRKRARKLPDEMVEKMWGDVQENLGKFQKLFGRNRMLIVDNSSYDNNDILDQIEKAVMSRIKTPVQNPIGRKWMKENSPENRKRNQPFGVRESLNEGLKITAKMPASMKRFINGLAKDRPDSWSNELTDLANSIIGVHREYDLDLSDSDKIGPQYINIRMEPASELTSRSIDMINQVWDNMGDQAKENIYADYSHWFKVGKKDRPLYGMYESTVNEKMKPLTKKHWDKADDDQKYDWLLQAFEDPVDAEQYVEYEWNNLPPSATQNMYESVVNERTAKGVGRYHGPDYKELMELLDMAVEYAKENLSVGKNFKIYYSDDRIMFDNPGGAAVGYDKRSLRKKDIFSGKREVVHTFKKANYNPEETKKQVEKHFNGKIEVELAKWQGEITGVNYIIK